MQAVSFEPDRHDLLRPPAFQSFTVNNGTDGMELVVDGQDRTTVRWKAGRGISSGAWPNCGAAGS